jgi:hypothetical protein
LFSVLRTPPSTRLPTMPPPIDDVLYGDDAATRPSTVSTSCTTEASPTSTTVGSGTGAAGASRRPGTAAGGPDPREDGPVPHLRDDPGTPVRDLRAQARLRGGVAFRVSRRGRHAGRAKEFAVHRSAYQLKEADPHTWALPRLSGTAKAAMVEIQADEYGRDRADMHQNAVRGHHARAGPRHRVQRLPAPPARASRLATTNLVSYFGLHRKAARCVGRAPGPLFEMTSVEPMGRYSVALRRHGAGAAARHFSTDVHVVADAPPPDRRRRAARRRAGPAGAAPGRRHHLREPWR